MIDLPRAHVLLYHDGWRPILARDRPSPSAHPAVVVGQLPSGRVVRERGPMDRVRQEG